MTPLLKTESVGFPDVAVNFGSVPSHGIAAHTGAGAWLEKFTCSYRAQAIPELLE